jgi:hypothetical protein
MYLTTELFPPSTEEDHEEELKGLEEARKAALEVAKEEDEAQEARPENEKGLIQTKLSKVGVWGNTASSRAPVTGMITNGYSERSGDVRTAMMNNWSDDP